mmetsp:Transcript_45171/g.118553  ORF Transcript_45171/g.118553 Transcript_45171/m.118553 type:complete len:572 (+) Transcript_45171:148-1863(+)
MGILPSLVFGGAAVGAALIYCAVLRMLYELSEHKEVTLAQLAAAIGYGLVVSVWAGAEAGFFASKMQPRYDAIASGEDDFASEAEGEEKRSLSSPTRPRADAAIFGIKATHLPTLRLWAELVAIMAYIYFCDRTTVVGKGPKYQSKQAFWGVNLVILVAALFTMRGGGSSGSAVNDEVHVKPLQRDQTEEWKGWMQIMFVLYHYFNEVEIYNAIRMYIAAYVWMTGFGNFSYYYVKKDFTAVRFAQMMWRLNFFVFFVCVTMNNEYMLYYICPMHTFFTWGVFLPLFACHSYNDDFKVLAIKIGLTLGVAFVLYDVPGVFQSLMDPLAPLLSFHDPLHPENSPMHEWFFRSGLDHLVWVFGMFCAFAFPWLDRQLQSLEEMPAMTRKSTRLAVLGATLAVGGYWYFHYFALPKRAYNAVHPYTSFIAIFAYLVLRNLTIELRKRHMHLFAWCGKITLETYILQFHVWMRTTGLNGSPKYLMVWFSASYWLNFVVVTAAYIFVSYRVFLLTAALRDVVIPKEGGSALITRAVLVGGILGALYLVAALAAPSIGLTIAAPVPPPLPRVPHHSP